MRNRIINNNNPETSLFKAKETTLLSNLIMSANNQHVITNKHWMIEYAGDQHIKLKRNTRFFDYFETNGIEYPIKKIKEFINSPTKTCDFFFSEEKNYYRATISKILSATNKIINFYIEIENITSQINNNKQMNTFIETMTHDLSIPVKSESNVLIQLLEEKFGGFTNHQKEILSEVLISHINLERMIENLLTGFHIDSEKFNIYPRSNSYKDSLERAVNISKYLISNKSQKLNIEYNSKINNFIFDKREIVRVLYNLITNASEHTQIGGEITIKVDDIDKNTLQTKIIDKGSGILKSNMPLMFCKDFATIKKFRKIGTGLGLYLSKKIIEAHHGKIKLESEINNGTTVTITLPTNLISINNTEPMQQECFQSSAS